MLPSDLVLYISFFVDDLDTILNLSRLSKETREKCTSNILWKSLMYRQWPEARFFVSTNYKNAFIARQKHHVTTQKSDFTMAVLGGQAVGKTSLSLQFAKSGVGLFSASDYEPALSAFVHSSEVTLHGKRNGVSILDCCAVQYDDSTVVEHLQSNPPDCYVLVFSYDNRSSFRRVKALDTFLKQIHGCPWYPRVIVGNKKDILDRKVTREEIQEFVQDNEVLFLETDSEQGISTNEAFMAIISYIQNHGSLADHIPHVWNQIVNQDEVKKQNVENNGWLSPRYIQFLIAKIILTILCIEFKYLNYCIQKFNKEF